MGTSEYFNEIQNKGNSSDEHFNFYLSTRKRLGCRLVFNYFIVIPVLVIFFIPDNG